MATEKKNPKLHELIAVRNATRAQATKCTTDLANTFEKKQHHFTAKIKSFTPFGENAETKVEEQLILQTTVEKELAWIMAYMVKAIDVSNAVNTGNMAAKASIVLEGSDGTPLVADVPATTLLELEGALDELRKFAEKIPTLDPAKGFKLDPAEGRGVYVGREVEKTRTLATKKLYVKFLPTDKHPGQADLIDEQVPSGTIREQEWSSMLTPVQKGDILDRIEKLSRAVKKARSRANDTEVSNAAQIGGTLLSYVFGQ